MPERRFLLSVRWMQSTATGPTVIEAATPTPMPRRRIAKISKPISSLFRIQIAKIGKQSQFRSGDTEKRRRNRRDVFMYSVPESAPGFRPSLRARRAARMRKSGMALCHSPVCVAGRSVRGVWKNGLPSRNRAVASADEITFGVGRERTVGPIARLPVFPAFDCRVAGGVARYQQHKWVRRLRTRMPDSRCSFP